MSYAVQAFNVRIASPGNEAIEAIIAREVLWDWNAHHTMERKQVLLPVCRPDDSCDFMVALFCPSMSAAMRETTGAEIERRLKAGCPVLIYSSEARTDLDEDDARAGEGLSLFKKRFGAAEVVDSYGDEKELRARLTRDLAATVARSFKAEPAVRELAPGSEEPEEELSELARVLLSEACEDFEAYIGRTKVGGTLKIQANGKQLVEQGNADSAAKWEAAFQELLAGAYIKDAGYNGQLFQISPKGFAFLKSIGKTPVGYIPEMGNI